MQNQAGNISDYRSALEQSCIVAITNQKGIIIYVNDNFCKISKYTREELVGQDHRIVNSGFHPKEFMRNLWTTISNGETWRGELKNRAKDGSIYWVSTTIVPFLDENGKPYQYIAIRSDITKQKTGEEKIHSLNEEILKSEKKFRGLIENSHDIVSIIDESGEILYRSPSAERVLGWTNAERNGDPMLNCIHPEDRVKLDEIIKTSIKNPGKPFHAGYRISHKNGNYIFLEGTITNMLNDDSIGGIIFNVSDVTQRKKAEEELLLFTEKLEYKVQLRTTQLESVNKELESFTYSVAHDLRTPLRAINGYASILEEDFSSNLADEAKRLLHEVKHNAEKMGTLIDELLSFSRLGKKEVLKTTINMNELVQTSILELYLTEKQMKSIHVHDLHRVSADSSLLKHVMTNLISNAIKYSSKEENPQITVASKKIKNQVIYHVSDNGVGFDMAFASKLFGVFQRLHSDDEFEGNGVGLAIVQRIINKHNGKIWATAKEGQGAVFSFSLPDEITNSEEYA